MYHASRGGEIGTGILIAINADDLAAEVRAAWNVTPLLHPVQQWRGRLIVRTHGP